MKSIFIKLDPYKFRVYLISCILILVSIVFTANVIVEEIISAAVLSFNIAAGLILINESKTFIGKALSALGYGLILLQFLEIFSHLSFLEKVLPILYILFFVAMSFKVYKEIFSAKKIDIEMLSAVFCGFITLGILTAFIILFTERLYPESFLGIDSNQSLFSNSIYFSFISILTIGYGDILPVTKIAKILIVLIGLTGNFYTVIITGIVIGKYLVHTKPSS